MPGSEKIKTMIEENEKATLLTRRHFLSTSAALVGAGIFSGSARAGISAKNLPNSKFNGVQIGVITYSFRSMPTDALSILKYLKEANISSVELMGDTIENFAGIPHVEVPDYPWGTELTDAQKTELAAAREKRAEIHRKWRLSASMKPFKKLRQMYNKAGVNIDITKLGSPGWSDEEIDYAFTVAKTMGARGFSTEISVESAKRLAPFAQKHNLFAIMHNHGQPGRPGFSFDEILDQGSHIMLNFDVGHYFGATGLHPNGIIEKYHNRIVSLHMKDKTAIDATPPDSNKPWGEGDTPIDEILLLLKEKQYPITADIELEYAIPQNSNAVLEVKKCVDFCRNILM